MIYYFNSDFLYNIYKKTNRILEKKLIDNKNIFAIMNLN